MKKLSKLLPALVCILTLAACAETDAPPTEAAQTIATEATLAEMPTIPVQTDPEVVGGNDSFTDIKNIRFQFSSGAGGWGTVLYIRPDGSFSGNFHDSEAETGPGYPNGAVSYCDFSGQFAQPERINTYTCSLKIEDLQYTRQPGAEEIRDGILYRYTDAHGMANADTFLLYLPGAPVEELPEDFTNWFGYTLSGLEELPFYGLYNAENWYCFSGTDIVQQIRSRVTEVEVMDAEIDTLLQEAYTQADINTASYERYLIWDELLNELWKVLKQLLPETEMRQLTNAQLVWIREKEATVQAIGAEVEGGSLYPAVTNGIASKMTKERVYVLLEYLP